MVSVRSPRISVITATYNRSEVLRYAVESILWQTFTDFEALIIGDGCTDDSAAVVREFGDPRLHWQNLPENSGHQSAPNNAGLSTARGEYIAYLGHDDLWLPNHLAKLLETIERTGAEVAYSWTELVYPAPSPLRIISGLNPSGEFEPDLGVPPSSLMHRRRLFEELGGWDDYRTIPDEPEVAWLRRAHAAGHKFACTNQLSVMKFNSAFRPNSYLTRRSDEQKEYARRIRTEPDFVVRELSAIVRSQIIRHPEDVPRAHDWSSDAKGGAIKRLRVARGLEPREERSAKTAPFVNGCVDFDSPAAEQYLAYGWSDAEEGFRWNDGTEAAVVFRLRNPRQCRVRLRCRAFLGGGKIRQQSIKFSLNGSQLSELSLTEPETVEAEVVLAADLVRRENLLVLSLPDAVSPAACGLSLDTRQLAVAMEWMDFVVD